MHRVTRKIPMHGPFQVGHGPVEMVPAHGLLHLAPDRFHRVQPRRIRRQKVKLENAGILFQIPPDLGAEVNREVVQHQVKRLPEVVLPQGFQKLDEFATALAVGDPDADLGPVEVDGPEAVAFPVLPGGRDPVLLARRLPVVAQNRLQVHVALVEKQQTLVGVLPGIEGRLQPVNRLFFWV